MWGGDGAEVDARGGAGDVEAIRAREATRPVGSHRSFDILGVDCVTHPNIHSKLKRATAIAATRQWRRGRRRRTRRRRIGKILQPPSGGGHAHGANADVGWQDGDVPVRVGSRNAAWKLFQELLLISLVVPRQGESEGEIDDDDRHRAGGRWRPRREAGVGGDWRHGWKRRWRRRGWRVAGEGRRPGEGWWRIDR